MTHHFNTFILGIFSGLAAHIAYHIREPTVISYILQTWTLIITFAYHCWLTHRTVLGIAQESLIFILVHMISLATSIVIYRIYLHPLKKYPGPFLAKITKWHGFYICNSGRTHVLHPEMLERYGDVVRIGPNELIFGDPAAVKDIHGAYSSKLAKGPNYDTRLWADGVGLGDTRSIPEHKRRRKLWDKGLNTKALVSYESRILGITEQFCTALEQRQGTEVNLADWMDYFAFDTMGDLAFNETFGYVPKGSMDSLRDVVRKGLYYTHHLRNVTWLSPFFRYLPQDPVSSAQLEEFVIRSGEMYTKRRRLGTKPQDLFTHLLQSDPESGYSLTEADLASDSPVIIIAGSDTTSVALSFAFYFMCRNPKVLQKLIEEIDRAWETESNPLVGNKLGEKYMPYMHGVLNESMRIVAPSPDGNQRTVPKGGHMINGVFFPAGTQVHSQPVFMQRDSRNFTHPKEFIPERWNDDTRDPSWNHNVHAFIPFSAGQYVCPGKALAYLEMRLFLVRVLRDYEFEMSPNFDHEGFWLGLKSYMGFIKMPLPLTIRKRGRWPSLLAEA